MSMPQTQLLKTLTEQYNLEEFKTLCFLLDTSYPDLKVQYDNLAGDTLQGKATSLLLHMRRYAHLRAADKLVLTMADQRPDLNLLVAEDLRIASAMPVGGGHTAASPTSNPMTTNTPSVVSAPQKEFINFDLRIYPKQGDKYPVEARHNYSGGAEEGPILQTFDLQDPSLQDVFRYFQDLVAEKNDATQFGEKLKGILFPSDIWSLFNTLRQDARRENKGVRLRLRIDPPELSRLPWEYCYDPKSRLFFAQDLNTPMVRYISSGYTPDVLASNGSLKILMVMAAPKNLPPLNMEKEEQVLRQALGDKLAKGQVELKILHNTTASKLQLTLAEMEPHVLHFVGHGEFRNGEGALILEDENQQAQRMTAGQLAMTLRHRGVRLIVLNACQTATGDEGDAFMSVAPALVLADIPAVIAMQFNVPDTMAIRYTESLYNYLALYKPLDLAVTEMRISAANGPSDYDHVLWGIPVLFMRAPDGVIWQRPNTAASSPTSGGGSTAAHQPAASPTTVVNDHSKTNTKMNAGNINFNIGGNYIAGDNTGGNGYNAQGDINIGDKGESAQPTVSLPDLYAQIEAAVPALIPKLDEFDREDLPNYIADGRKELDRQRLPKVAKELKDARDIVRKHKAIAADLLAKIDQAIALADK